MPATVLQILEDDGVYPNLYYGKNLLTEVPQDLYKQDWWYRTTFTAPADRQTYRLDFPGINYRAEIWLNGHRVADDRQIVGMYNGHDLDVSRWIQPGRPNTLAVKVIPERAIQDVDGVELADSWYDWINWRYLGCKVQQEPGQRQLVCPGPKRRHLEAGVPQDIRCGVDRRSHRQLRTAAARHRQRPADRLRHAAQPFPRPGARRAAGDDHPRRQETPIHVDEPVALAPGEDRELSLGSDEFAQLRVSHPDLWWPYTKGLDPYDLLEFVQRARSPRRTRCASASARSPRAATASDTWSARTPAAALYLKVNGKDFLVRGPPTPRPALPVRPGPRSQRS
jgi:exo-1,4-beta-D-glucosaminidase